MGTVENNFLSTQAFTYMRACPKCWFGNTVSRIHADMKWLVSSIIKRRSGVFDNDV